MLGREYKDGISFTDGLCYESFPIRQMFTTRNTFSQTSKQITMVKLPRLANIGLLKANEAKIHVNLQGMEQRNILQD